MTTTPARDARPYRRASEPTGSEMRTITPAAPSGGDRSAGTASCDGPGDGRDCPESVAVRAHYTSRTAAQVREDGSVQGWACRRRRGGQLVDLYPGCRKDGGR